MKRTGPPKRKTPLQARKPMGRGKAPKTKPSPVSGSIRPTAEQQRWHDWLRQQGCAICGQRDPEVHHCVGSAGKHNGVWIGQDFVLPLCTHHHTGMAGIHSNIEQFCADGGIPMMRRKELEKRLFRELVAHYTRHGHVDKPVRDEALVAIDNYTR